MGKSEINMMTMSRDDWERLRREREDAGMNRFRIEMRDLVPEKFLILDLENGQAYGFHTHDDGTVCRENIGIAIEMTAKKAPSFFSTDRYDD